MAIKILVSLPFCAEPIHIWLCDALHLPDKGLGRSFVKLLLLGVATFLSIVFRKDLAVVMEFCGIAIQNAIVVIFPCAITLRLQWSNYAPLARSGIMVLLTVFSLYMVVGTVQFL